MKMIMLMAALFVLQSGSVYDFSFKSIDGKDMNLALYKGKKILIVNTASECGFTPQYKGLEELYEKYKDKLVIIGFPANNFGGQEPGSNDEIAQFCSARYQVTFPMAAKISVKGKDIHPLFQWLTEQENPDFTGSVKWNFEKFLIAKDGSIVERFRSKVEPTSKKITSAIETELTK